jgi:3-oxoacyl-[acyl-carrier protein] reductase
MSTQQKVALVTGGASGIGLAISNQLLEDGYLVVVNYQASKTAADAFVSAALATGKQAIAFQANIAEYAQVETLITSILNTFGRLDCVVNNAGINDDTLVLRMREEQFDRVIATNLKGAWAVSKLALRHLMQSPSGRLIHIASVAGIMGNVGQANYAASKAGMIGLSKTLAREVASRQVTVNVVAPGFIETKMTDKLSDTIKEQALTMIPLKRFGKPEDIAMMVSFLASDHASYITGQTFVVDGGMVMQ